MALAESGDWPNWASSERSKQGIGDTPLWPIRTLQFGISCFTVAAMPAMSEPPPVQTKIASMV
jgi:hypothetical protein